jgi:sulfur carrier protein
VSASNLSIHLNGQPHPIAPGQTVADLVAGLALTGKRIAVERNGEIVPRAAHALTVLSAGDRLEIVVAVGGG